MKQHKYVQKKKLNDKYKKVAKNYVTIDKQTELIEFKITKGENNDEAKSIYYNADKTRN